MNDSALTDRYPWMIYVVLTLAVLTTSYVIIISKFIRRHRIGRPNAMASVASDEAFLLMECIKKMR